MRIGRGTDQRLDRITPRRVIFTTPLHRRCPKTDPIHCIRTPAPITQCFRNLNAILKKIVNLLFVLIKAEN